MQHTSVFIVVLCGRSELNKVSRTIRCFIHRTFVSSACNVFLTLSLLTSTEFLQNVLHSVDIYLSGILKNLKYRNIDRKLQHTLYLVRVQQQQ